LENLIGFRLLASSGANYRVKGRLGLIVGVEEQRAALRTP
jgi:hypothetical protein